jgi:DNA-directed RNA polymerase specialized sigma24 family protein
MQNGNPRRAGKSSPAWKKFEAEVQRILELSGYTVSRDVLIAGAQTDLIGHRRIGGILTRLLIECKHSEEEQPVSGDEVENFVARVITLRNKDEFDHGYLISNVGFTRNAKAAAGVSFIELLTVPELYRRVFDFSSYAHSLALTFKESPLSRTFILPYMAEMSLSIAEDETGTISVERAPSSSMIEMTNFCDQWIGEPGGGRLCLLGDYGAGKTSFCTWFAHRQADKYLSNPSTERIPLLMSLRRYTKALDVRAMVTDFLVNDCGIHNFRLPAFEALLQKGLFLIIVDGFDEMSRYVDQEVRYRTIAELGWLGQGESKVILTGRPSYFPTHEELVQVLGSHSPDDVYEAARNALDELTEYNLYEIQPFSEDQIKRFIAFCSDNIAQAESIWEKIYGTYNLLDLASRPVLLEMIVKSLPQLLTKSNAVVNSAKLYDIYTAAWLDREARKGEFRKLINKEQKLRFMEELAMQLFGEGKQAISYKQMGHPIKEFFKIDDSDQFDFFSHDIRTCAFLRRAANSDYEFVHRSFQEFFLAKKLISDVFRGARGAWDSQHLPPEAIRFTAELLDRSADAVIIEHLMAWAAQEPQSPLGKNCIAVTCLSGRPIPTSTAESYGMTPETLMSAAAYQLGYAAEGKKFEEFVYLRAVQRVRIFLEREIGFNKLDSHDIVHDEFLSVMNTLRGKPLQTAAEIDRLIVTSIRWASIDPRQKHTKNRGYRDLLEGVRDEDYQIEEASRAASPEDIVLAREIMEWMRLSYPRVAKLLWRYYVEGESWSEIAAETGEDPKALRIRFTRGLRLVRQELEGRKAKQIPSP